MQIEKKIVFIIDGVQVDSLTAAKNLEEEKIVKAFETAWGESHLPHKEFTKFMEYVLANRKYFSYMLSVHPINDLT